ncbi:MAG: PaP73 [Marmoricola sp.]|nr:PaP73 [Marmoricola sp.]
MELRYYQQAAKAAIFDYFEKGNDGNPLVGMPTGTGKSLVIADTIREVLQGWPGQRVMMLTHVAKLIEQNTKTLLNVWPNAPVGIHSQGLKQREYLQPIIMGGVQSVYKNVQQFGWRDLLFIDEAHLIGPTDDTQYAATIGALKAINPRLKVIGFSATLFRLKQGELIDGGLFTDVCYDLTGYQEFNKLIAEGFIAPLIGKPTAVKFDISDVAVTAGDYNGKQLEAAIDKDELTFRACKEILEYAYDRKSWMIFSAGISHAEHIAAMLGQFGIPAAAVHSKLSDTENEKRLKAFEAGEYRAIVGNNKLTTGYDHPPIDFIADMQPTCSPGKHVQKYGRGTRISTGKDNCLVLDFAGNVPRNGPINDPVKPRKPGQGGGGDAPVRICDNCGAYNHASARFCCNCAEAFNFAPKIFQTAGNHEILKSDQPVIEWFDVNRVFYTMHEKKDEFGNLKAPPSMRVQYVCGLRRFDEWMAFESAVPYVRHKAHDWWKQRHASEPPPTTWQALQHQSQLRQPKRIQVHLNKKFPEIKGYDYE